ncbi:GDP-mannose 4,6-dehydratase [Bradyrhizobium sp. KBS0727]|uniref:GDP-mannose 4,6-dehydratase n=1 Tax=unclassified Bradyrhizobium TaxID=2631580 RepID=UPI00352C5C43
MGLIGSAVVRHLLPRYPSAGRQRRQTDLCRKFRLAARRDHQSTLRLRATMHLRWTSAAEVLREVSTRAVMNLAAESHVDRSIDSPSNFLQTNVVGTFTLLQEALRHWRSLSGEKRACFHFLHISTDEVFWLTRRGRSLHRSHRLCS